MVVKGSGGGGMSITSPPMDKVTYLLTPCWVVVMVVVTGQREAMRRKNNGKSQSQRTRSSPSGHLMRSRSTTWQWEGMGGKWETKRAKRDGGGRRDKGGGEREVVIRG